MHRAKCSHHKLIFYGPPKRFSKYEVLTQILGNHAFIIHGFVLIVQTKTFSAKFQTSAVPLELLSEYRFYFDFRDNPTFNGSEGNGSEGNGSEGSV